MKKAYIAGGIIAVIVTAVVVVIVVKNNSSAPSSGDVSRYKLYDACEMLTEQKASEALGTSATHSDEAAPVSSDDLKVSSCTYNNGAGSVQDIVSVSLLARSPLTDVGAASNRNGMEDGTIVGNTPVDGYGDKAVWNQDTGQLNVLKDNSWFILSYGGAQPNTRSLDDVKKLADKVF